MFRLRFNPSSHTSNNFVWKACQQETILNDNGKIDTGSEMGGLPNSNCTTLHLLHLNLCHHYESSKPSTFHVLPSPCHTQPHVPAAGYTNTFGNPCSHKTSTMKNKRLCSEAGVCMRKSGLHTASQWASKIKECILHAHEIDEVPGVVLQPHKSLPSSNLDLALAHFAPRMLGQMQFDDLKMESENCMMELWKFRWINGAIILDSTPARFFHLWYILFTKCCTCIRYTYECLVKLHATTTFHKKLQQ